MEIANNVMDDLDIAILEELQRNGRKRFTKIADTLGVTEGTVRNRVAKLQEDNVIQIIGLLDPHRVGYDAPAVIGVSIQPPHLETAALEIAAKPEVSYLIMVSGEFDLIVEVMCRDREHLASFLTDQLQNVVGVMRTQTFMILHTYKMAQGAQPVAQNGRAKSEE